MSGISELLHEIGLIFPPWMLLILAGVGLVVGIPGLQNSVKTRQIRERVRQMVRADPSRRVGLADNVMGVAGKDVHLLSLLAREARRREQLPLYQRALTALDALPEGRKLAEAVRAEVRAPRDLMSPLQAIGRIEAAIDEGQFGVARHRLSDALAQHPDHPELLALGQRLSASDAVPLDGANTGP